MALDRVREQLPLATDFAELYELFDEQLVVESDLWTSSEIGSNDDLVGFVETIAAQVRPSFVPLSECHFEVRGTGFWHGMVTGANGIACFFYDDQIGVGLTALTDPFDGTPLTHFIRFTKVMIDRVAGRLPN